MNMRKYTYRKILSVFVIGAMVLSLSACGNKLEKDLKEAHKKVAQSEEQEEKLMSLLEGLGVDTQELDLSALEELADYSDMESFSEAGEDKAYSNDEIKSKEQGTSSDSGSKNKFKKYQSGEFAGILLQDKYYMEYTSYIWGMEGSGKTAMDGKNSSTISEMMGYSTWSLILDGYQYDFDTAQKIYTKTEMAEVEAYLDDMQIDYSNMEYVGSGNGEIPGMEDAAGYEAKSLDYDEFQIMIDMGELAAEEDSAMPITIRFYMDGSELYAIYTQTMGIDSVMVIETLSKDVPKEMFEIPGDYTEVDSLY